MSHLGLSGRKGCMNMRTTLIRVVNRPKLYQSTNHFAKSSQIFMTRWSNDSLHYIFWVELKLGNVINSGCMPMKGMMAIPMTQNTQPMM